MQSHHLRVEVISMSGWIITLHVLTALLGLLLIWDPFNDPAGRVMGWVTICLVAILTAAWIPMSWVKGFAEVIGVR